MKKIHIKEELKKVNAILMVYNPSLKKYQYVNNVSNTSIDFSPSIVTAKRFTKKEAKDISKELSKDLIHAIRLPTSL